MQTSEADEKKKKKKKIKVKVPGMRGSCGDREQHTYYLPMLVERRKSVSQER